MTAWYNNLSDTVFTFVVKTSVNWFLLDTTLTGDLNIALLVTLYTGVVVLVLP